MSRTLVLAVLAFAGVNLSCAERAPLLGLSSSSWLSNVFSEHDLLVSSPDTKTTFVLLHPSLRISDLVKESTSNLEYLKNAFASASSNTFLSFGVNSENVISNLKTSYTNSHYFQLQEVMSSPKQSGLIVIPIETEDLALLNKAIQIIKEANEDATILLSTASSTMKHRREVGDNIYVRRDVSEPAPLPKSSSSQGPKEYVAFRPERRHTELRQFFTVPLYMGIIVVLFVVFMVLVGVYGLMASETPESWPDPQNDQNLIVPN